MVCRFGDSNLPGFHKFHPGYAGHAGWLVDNFNHSFVVLTVPPIDLAEEVGKPYSAPYYSGYTGY
jgi:hypothetical protein